jgi:integrase
MAGVRKKGEGWHCTFRFQGSRYYFALGNITEQQAHARAVEVDEILDLIERGRLTVPENVRLEDFVAAGGKVPVISARPDTITARQLFDRYLETHGNGTIEQSTLSTRRTHLDSIASSLGDRFRIQAVTLADLQVHVDRRRRKNISPYTIKQEIATLTACWNWATAGGLVKGVLPKKGLRFPKEDEKELFRTFADIQAIIENENPDDARKDALWESLYLTRPETQEFLEHVQVNASLPWVYPMTATAAYTGARRSELLRMLVVDLDLIAGVLTIREKKRVKGRRSTRTAPVTPRLAGVLKEWLGVKPESPFLFCQAAQVTRSKTKRETPTAVTKNEAHDQFKRAISGSKWAVVRGWHVLRHSFCSNMVAAGIDQRIIDEIMGHSTEEQRRRYRHLAPRITASAVAAVFG